MSSINRVRSGLVQTPRTVSEESTTAGGQVGTSEEQSGSRRAPNIAHRNAARAGAMQQGSQLQQQLQADLGQVASDIQALADFVTLFTQLFESQIKDMFSNLGYDIDDLNSPEAKQAIEQIKDYAGLPPNSHMDFDLMLALMLAQAEQDRYGGSGGGGGKGSGYGGGPKNHKVGSGGGMQLKQTKEVDVSNWKAGKGDVTADQLVSIAQQSGHQLSAKRAAEVAPHLNRAMAEANIDTPKKKAAFIAQLMHESGGFKYNEEIASGAAYEGRKDLGNTQPGDGKRFKGRGFIQLTGRANYAAAGKALGLDLVKHPELAASDANAARVAAWFWNSRGLSKHAEAGNFDTVTKRINGGFNGKADRDRLYGNALNVLKDSHGVPSTGEFLEPEPMTTPGVTSATDGMSEAQKYDYYKQLIEQNGGTVSDAPGQQNIVGLRTENHKSNRYDDRMAVIWKDENGNPRVREFAANMESISRYQGRYGNDVNGDGRRDLATLSAGTHGFAKGHSGQFGNILRPTSTTAVYRDTDGDGRGDTLDRTGAGQSILFHKGGRSDVGSAGCQTMDPDTFNQFWATLGNQSSFQYTVVDVG
jgi:predicted chitinase